MLDMKFSRITQFQTSTHALVRCYRGEITTELEESGLRQPPALVTRYRRLGPVMDVFIDSPGRMTEYEILKEAKRRIQRRFPGEPFIPAQENA